MEKSVFSYIILFILLILVQVLICNHIVLFSVAVAFIFIYFFVSLPMNMSVNWVIVFSFIAGFLVDIFSDTPGVNSLACTLLAVLRKPIFFAYVPRDDKTKVIQPSIRALGYPVYCKYLLTMCAVYCLFVFSIEYFSFSDIKDIVIMAVSSTAFTFVITLALASLLQRGGGHE